MNCALTLPPCWGWEVTYPSHLTPYSHSWHNYCYIYNDEYLFKYLKK